MSKTIEERSKKFQDLTGCVFGEITVLSFSRMDGTQAIWNCRCSCGKIYESRGDNLKYRKMKACRSCSIITHRAVIDKEVEYTIWASMKQRCLNPKNKNYNNYGGRGIKIQQSWIDSYDNFIKDMGKRPSSKYSIERLDVNGNYEKRNCIWMLKSKQSLNTRRVSKIYVPHLKQTYNSIKETAIALGFSSGYVSEMLNGKKKNHLKLKRV